MSTVAIETAVVRHDPTALVTSNPIVRHIATRCGWRAETLVARVQAALPAPIEQQLYLRLARSVRIQPESIAKILRGLLGQRELQPSDMLDRPQGRNLASNLFAETATQVTEVLAITHVLKSEYGNASVMAATKLVQAYGPDHVEVVADSLREYIDSAFGGDAGRERRTAIAISWLADEGLRICGRDGVPYPHDVAEWLESHAEARISLHRRIGAPRPQ